MRVLLKWVLRLLPLFYMLLIWIMSSLPANAIVELPDLTIDALIKESLHLVEFAILYLLLVLSFFTFDRFSTKINILCGIIAALYGVTDEIHQSFVPYRSATLIDVIKDVTGVAVAFYFVQKKYKADQFRKIRAYFQETKSSHHN